MKKRIYGKAKKTGIILTMVGLLGVVLGVNLLQVTGNTDYIALAALSVFLMISGLVTFGVYFALDLKVGSVFSDESALLNFKISTETYDAYATAEIEDLKVMNKMTLRMALFFCGLVTVVGPFVVTEAKMVPAVTGVAIAIFITVISKWITAYRVEKLKKGDLEVILTLKDAYVGSQYHTWSLPTTYLADAVFYGVGEYEGYAGAAIKITYFELVNPHSFLLPIPVGKETDAQAATNLLKGKVKPPAQL